MKVRSSVKPICEKVQSYQEKRQYQNYLRKFRSTNSVRANQADKAVIWNMN